jgi:hypothetical protein
LGGRAISTLKIQTPEALTLIEIKAELKKRAEAKAKRMWLRKPQKAGETLRASRSAHRFSLKKRPQQPP